MADDPHVHVGPQKKPVRLPKVAVRWLERFIEEREPTHPG
jgi:hypothetical protein